MDTIIIQEITTTDTITIITGTTPIPKIITKDGTQTGTIIIQTQTVISLLIIDRILHNPPIYVI